MTDHLPECIYEPEHWDVEQSILWSGKPCICPALRACEQRVRQEEYSLPEGHPSRDLSYWEAGFSVGLQAARDAVAAVPPRAETATTATGFFIPKRSALAAIDALRD